MEEYKKYSVLQNKHSNSVGSNKKDGSTGMDYHQMTPPAESPNHRMRSPFKAEPFDHNFDIALRKINYR